MDDGVNKIGNNYELRVLRINFYKTFCKKKRQNEKITRAHTAAYRIHKTIETVFLILITLFHFITHLNIHIEWIIILFIHERKEKKKNNTIIIARSNE